MKSQGNSFPEGAFFHAVNVLVGLVFAKCGGPE